MLTERLFGIRDFVCPWSQSGNNTERQKRPRSELRLRKWAPSDCFPPRERPRWERTGRRSDSDTTRCQCQSLGSGLETPREYCLWWTKIFSLVSVSRIQSIINALFQGGKARRGKGEGNNLLGIQNTIHDVLDERLQTCHYQLVVGVRRDSEETEKDAR